MSRAHPWALLALAILPLAQAQGSAQLDAKAPNMTFGAVDAEGTDLRLFHLAFDDGTFAGNLYNGTVIDRQRHIGCGQNHDVEVELRRSTTRDARPAEYRLRKGSVAIADFPATLVPLARGTAADAARTGAVPAAYLGPNTYQFVPVTDEGAPDVTREARAFPTQAFLAIPATPFVATGAHTINLELGTIEVTQGGETFVYETYIERVRRTCSPGSGPVPIPTDDWTTIVHRILVRVDLGTFTARQGDLSRTLGYWKGERGADNVADAEDAPAGYWNRAQKDRVQEAYDAYALPYTLVTAQDLVLDVHGRARFLGAVGSVNQNGTFTEAKGSDLDLSGQLLLRPESHSEGGRRMVTRLEGSVYDLDVAQGPNLDWGTLMMGAAGGATLVGAALYAWPGFRWRATQILLFPLYARLKKEDILENPLRDDILHAVQQQPGISASELGRRLDCGWGTLVYHLTVLERMRLVSSAREGRHKRFFAQGRINYSDKGAVGLLANPAARNILDAIRASPGAIQKDLSARLGLSAGTIAWHVDRLEGEGLILREEEGRVVRYYPSDRLLDLTRRLAA